MGAIQPTASEGTSSASSNRTNPNERALAVVGIGLAVFGIVISVLMAVAEFATAMLITGLLVGVPVGVLLGPVVRRGALWLAHYLER